MIVLAVVIKLVVVLMLAFFPDSPGEPLTFHYAVKVLPGQTLQYCEEHKAEVAAQIIPPDAAITSVECHEADFQPKDSI